MNPTQINRVISRVIYVWWWYGDDNKAHQKTRVKPSPQKNNKNKKIQQINKNNDNKFGAYVIPSILKDCPKPLHTWLKWGSLFLKSLQHLWEGKRPSGTSQKTCSSISLMKMSDKLHEYVRGTYTRRLIEHILTHVGKERTYFHTRGQIYWSIRIPISVSCPYLHQSIFISIYLYYITVCMVAYVCVWLYVGIYVLTYACMYVWIHYIRTHRRIYNSINICMYICMCLSVFYVCLPAHPSVYIYNLYALFIYQIYLHTYIYMCLYL